MSFFDSLMGGDKKETVDPKLETAQQFINVRDVRGSILYTKDGHLICFIRIQPVSVDLLSEREKVSYVRSMTAELSSERKPFRLLSISRPVDINRQIAELMELRAESHDPVQKDLLKEEIMQLSDFATGGEVIERQFFFLIWESRRADAEAELIKRAQEFIGRLKAGKIDGELCGQGAIVQLLNQMNNPAYAHLEDADMERSIPIITAMRREGDNGKENG